jgi:hypothetical protein
MKQPELPIEGACRCGRTRIRVSAAPFMTAACHCVGCQRMAASAFSLTAMVPTEGFEVTQGEPVIAGLKGPDLQHNFCPECMTWMFTRIAGAGFVNVRPTMFDDVAWFEPFIETCTAEKLAWATTPARHRFEAFPPVETYESLMREFAEAVGT